MSGRALPPGYSASHMDAWFNSCTKDNKLGMKCAAHPFATGLLKEFRQHSESKLDNRIWGLTGFKTEAFGKRLYSNDATHKVAEWFSSCNVVRGGEIHCGPFPQDVSRVLLGVYLRCPKPSEYGQMPRLYPECSDGYGPGIGDGPCGWSLCYTNGLGGGTEPKE